MYPTQAKKRLEWATHKLFGGRVPHRPHEFVHWGEPTCLLASRLRSR